MPYVRVHFTIAYVVPAGRQDMIEAAKEAIVDDLASAFKHGWNIEIDHDPTAHESDVPEFIREQCEEECDECGWSIPAGDEGESIANHHHAKTCSLYQEPAAR